MGEGNFLKKVSFPRKKETAMPRLDRDISELRSSLFGCVEEVQDEYQGKGWLPARLNLNKGIVRGLLELFSWGSWQLYYFLAHVHKQAIPL